MLQFARDGVKGIVAVDISIAALVQTASVLQEHYPEVALLQLVADLTDEDQVNSLFEKAVAHFGRIDYAVNNAAISGLIKPTTETSFSSLDRILGVNLKGVWLCERAELKQMLTQSPISTSSLYVSHLKYLSVSPPADGSHVESRPGRGLSRGSIINVDSVLGHLAVPGNGPYTMSKHG